MTEPKKNPFADLFKSSAEVTNTQSQPPMSATQPAPDWMIQAVLVGVGILVVLAAAFWLPSSVIFELPDFGDPGFDLVEGRVDRVLSTETVEAQEDIGVPAQIIQELEVRVTKGELAGTTALVEQGSVSVGSDSDPYDEGDQVLLYTSELPDGTRTFSIQDYVRRDGLLLLVTLFVIAVLLTGRWQGARSLIALAVTLLILLKFIIPGILSGQDPVLITVLGAGSATVLSVVLSHGINSKSAAAAAGGLAALFITGVIASLAVDGLHFTGVSSEEATFVQGQTGGQISLRGLLLAGILIGSLGVLYDVTILQASAIFELKRTNPRLGFQELFLAGTTVGRDHVAATVDTLVLAYAGASLPLLLLVTIQAQPFEILTSREFMAEEIARALIGSLGIIAAIPITNAIAAWLAIRPRGHWWRPPPAT
jgi:uncharacterized membrane protein